MSSWAPRKYKTTNWSAYNEALERRGSLSIWFDSEMPWRPPLTGKRGRQRSFSKALRASKYLGRAIRRRRSGCHRQSPVETKMTCIKLLGQSLMARDLDRQGAELQLHIAVLHDYTAHGIPVRRPVELIRPGKGDQPQAYICATKQGRALDTLFVRFLRSGGKSELRSVSPD